MDTHSLIGNKMILNNLVLIAKCPHAFGLALAAVNNKRSLELRLETEFRNVVTNPEYICSDSEKKLEAKSNRETF